MKLCAFLLLGFGVWCAIVWWNMPPESSMARVDRQIAEWALRHKLQEREKHFCAVTEIYAP